jgi:hypothetical protein
LIELFAIALIAFLFWAFIKYGDENEYGFKIICKFVQISFAHEN